MSEKITSIQMINSSSFPEWFEDWIRANEMKVSYSGIYSIKGKPIKGGVLRALLYQESKLASRKFSYQDIDASLDLQHNQVRETYLREKIDGLAKPFIENDSLKKFVFALTGKDDENDLSVFEHFIWQVKRKLLNLPVENHMMPVICGKSGSGKSIAIRKLLSPLHQLTAEKDLDCFKDERQHSIFEDYYVVFFDEMAKSQSADFDAMKKIISADQTTWRPLYGNKQQVLTNHSTMIGTSNYAMDEMIRDYTSSRRWYQVNSSDLCDWESINSIDYEKAWQSVNAFAECPVIKHLEVIRARQEASRYKTDAEEFISEVGLVPSIEGKMKAQDLYDAYKKWCDQNGSKPWTKNYLGRQLRRLGFEPIFMGSRSRRCRGYYAMAEGIAFEPNEELSHE